MIYRKGKKKEVYSIGEIAILCSESKLERSFLSSWTLHSLRWPKYPFCVKIQPRLIFCRQLNKNVLTVLSETVIVYHIQLQAKLGIISNDIGRQVISSKWKLFTVTDKILNIFKSNQWPSLSVILFKVSYFRAFYSTFELM